MFRSSEVTPTARRLLGTTALVTAAIALAACGNSSKSLSAPTVKAVATESSTAPASAPASDSSGDAASGASGSPASAPASSPASAAAVSGGSDPHSGFCTFAKNEEAQSQKLSTDLSTATPDGVKSYISDTQKALLEFEQAAPSAIQSEVKEVVSLDQKLFTALENNGYSFAKAGPAIEAAAMDPAFTAAVAKLGTYLMTTCGITSTG